MKNIIEELTTLSKGQVHIKDKVKLKEILDNMAREGLKKLQVVSDFDRTITKQHHNGVPHLSSFAMFSRMRPTAENSEYQATVTKLRKKYYPIEMNPHIKIEDKIKHMEEWWELSEKAITGLKVSQQDIEEVCLESKPALRERSQEFFKELYEDDVPVVVFSAGCGDVVLTVLKQCGVYHPNVKVVSNFLNFDKDGTILGFKDKIIHIFNKNEYALQNTDFYHLLKERVNAIVMGDSLGDANMIEGTGNCKNVLKIGFLFEHVEEALPQYLDTFDIVLVDDQTMDVPRGIFNYIKSSCQS